MSKSTRSDNVDLVPADRQAGAAYDRDFYSWSLEQARLVREGNWDAVDRVNIAEEIEIVGTRAVQQAGKRISSAVAALAEMGPSADQAVAQLDYFRLERSDWKSRTFLPTIRT